MKTFKFIKAVSDTVLDTMNATDCAKPLIFTGAMFQEKLVSHRRAVSEILQWHFMFFVFLQNNPRFRFETHSFGKEERT